MLHSSPIVRVFQLPTPFFFPARQWDSDVRLSYFTPHCIKNVGTFQDGGLTFNNPAAIAMNETAALFPTAPKPSIVVSLGTGSVPPKRTESSASGNMLRNTFAARLFRAFWKQSDSGAAWRQLLSHHNDADGQGYYRFDIEFDAKQPALDDVSSMAEIGRMAREASLGSCLMRRLAKQIRAELFIFALDECEPPQFVSGVLECVGNISCRLKPGSAGFLALMAQLSDGSASFMCQGDAVTACFGKYRDNEKCAAFSQTVRFQVPNRQQPFQISLQEGSSASNISASPFTLEWLAERQATEAYFGTIDHRKRPRPSQVSEPLAKRKRLR